MDLLAELEQFKNDFQDANAKVASLEESLKQNAEALTNANSELATVKEALTAKESELAAKEADVNEKAEQLAKIQAQLESLKAEKKTAEELAVEKLAAIGAKPMAVAPETPEAVTTREQALAAFADAQTPSAKAAVWKQFKHLFG